MPKADHKATLKLTYHEYCDKILAGWIGKSLGGTVGAPYENHKQFNQVTREELWPKIIYPNDDLDIQVVWLEALQELGLYFDSIDLARFWQERCFYICCEYGIFINNLEHGIYPPLSGVWNNPFFTASEGCPIRSEIWGYINPGNPELAAEYAEKDGCLDHGKPSIEVEQFLAAAASLSFFSDDLNFILDEACKVIPADSEIIRVLNYVRKIMTQFSDLHDIWIMIVRAFGNRDASNASMNLAITLVALFAGGKDFKKVIHICVQYGWDADCSAATAGALFGSIYGTELLPKDWMDKMGDTLVCAVEIKHQFTSLADFADETARIGVEMAQCRNTKVEILDAPQVTVRPVPAPKITISVEYPAAPVLWNSKKTPMVLHIHNPAAEDFNGFLEIKTPSGVDCSLVRMEIALPAGNDDRIVLEASSKVECKYLNDKNLFTAKLISEEGSIVCEHIFGLEGARQWQVYGPYWDMWDKEKHEICPFQNDDIKCNPSAIPGCLDFFNHHVRLEHPYLDEEKLLHEDIPAELPFSIETGGDKVSNKDLCDFVGAACYYLVRTVKSAEEAKDVILGIGRSMPYKLWFDGKWMETLDTYTCWAPEYEDRNMVDLNGKEQRLVIKIVAQADNFEMSHAFVKVVPTKKKAISPYYTDIAYLKK